MQTLHCMRHARLSSPKWPVRNSKHTQLQVRVTLTRVSSAVHARCQASGCKETSFQEASDILWGCTNSREVLQPS
jgi:hypothetical protein